MHSHKISTPTGTPVPDEKVKELSSKGPSKDLTQNPENAENIPEIPGLVWKGYLVLGVLCWARVIFCKDGMFWTSLCWTDSVGRKVLGTMLLMQSVGQMLRHGKCWAVVILWWIFL